MSDHVPLSTMRVFEAAARHENFSRAADEVHITHGAVSHRIKALEDFIGVPLFVRQGRGVALNADGRTLADAVRDALGRIDGAARAIRRKHDRQRLTISVMPSFGSRWLMPRMVGFMSRYPGWEVNIDSTSSLVDFTRDEVDVAIRFGAGPWPGLHGERVLEDEYILVASPRLFRGRPPKDPRRMVDYPLMRADAEPWRAWCAAAKVDVALPSAGVGYQDMGVSLQSAVDGQGLMLSRRSIAAAELERGTLVALFDIGVPAGSAYWIVWPLDPPPSERTIAFRDWFIEEIASSRQRRTVERPRTRARRST